ncbi:MAG: hypothetical protein WBP75_13480 [Candidatus Cybelea sp.]
MGLATSEEPKGSGLKTAIDILIAPKDALEALRVVPTWGWALIVTLALMVLGYFLAQPAAQHASLGTLTQAFATNPLYTNLSDEQKRQMLERVAHPPAYQTALGLISLVLVLFVSTLLNAVVLLAANAIAHGSADFKRLFAGSMNIAVPAMGLYSVTLGVICRVLGAEHFTTTTDVLRAIPGLALLAPGATGKLATFLAGIHIFTLWGYGLNVGVMRITAGVKNALSWAFPLFILIAGAALQAASSGFSGG